MSISVEHSQKRLALVWFIGAGILFLLLFFQTILGAYGEGKANEAWGWLLPSIMPTLSLIIGILVSDIFAKDSSKKTVNLFVYRIALTLSFVYLIVVSLTILLGPYYQEGTKSDRLELMKLSNLWLGPFQGLVSAAMGAFFVTRQKKSYP